MKNKPMYSTVISNPNLKSPNFARPKLINQLICLYYSQVKGSEKVQPLIGATPKSG